MTQKHYAILSKSNTIYKNSDRIEIPTSNITEVSIPSEIETVFLYDEPKPHEEGKINMVNERCYYIGKFLNKQQVMAKYGMNSHIYEHIMFNGYAGLVEGRNNSKYPILSEVVVKQPEGIFDSN